MVFSCYPNLALLLEKMADVPMFLCTLFKGSHFALQDTTPTLGLGSASVVSASKLQDLGSVNARLGGRHAMALHNPQEPSTEVLHLPRNRCTTSGFLGHAGCNVWDDGVLEYR